MTEKDLPSLNIQDYPNLEPFITQQSQKFTAYLLAARFRRGRARNAATQYGAGTLADPAYISGADRDLYANYQHLLKMAELSEASDKLYETLLDKKLQAELIIENLREPEHLDHDQRRELLLELTALEDDIERMTGLLEDLE
jgi:hypothetical protein